LTRRANQRHDAIIAARVIGGALAKFIGTGAIQHHAQTQAFGEVEGKKKMRQFGKVDIPQEAFITALRVDS
jgi:translation elongation factor EF-4